MPGAWRACARSRTGSWTLLTNRQRRDIEGILSWENIESMRGIDDAYMSERCGGGWCYRDGWSLSCYFEVDSGWPPLELENITHCSFGGEELPFESLEIYISSLSSEVIGNPDVGFPYDSSRKVKPGVAKKIVSQAIEAGLDAIEKILWTGSARLIRELDKAALDRGLSYELTDDCFMVRYGNTVCVHSGFASVLHARGSSGKRIRSAGRRMGKLEKGNDGSSAI